MIKEFVLAVLFVLLFSSPGYCEPARYKNGRDLMSACSTFTGLKESYNLDTMYCVGYVTGTLDSYLAIVDAMGSPPLFCVDPGVSGGQLTLVVKKHIKNKPALLNLSGAKAVIIALGEAFPCKKQKNHPR
jgi:hypothetical protein